MPRLGLKPTPKKRYHGGRWRIYWKWNSEQYSIPTNYLDEKKTAQVDSDLRFISAALAMEEPDFPELYAESPAVLQYMLDRYGRNDQSDIPTDPDWIPSKKCGTVRIRVGKKRVLIRRKSFVRRTSRLWSRKRPVTIKSGFELGSWMLKVPESPLSST